MSFERTFIPTKGVRVSFTLWDTISLDLQVRQRQETDDEYETNIAFELTANTYGTLDYSTFFLEAQLS